MHHIARQRHTWPRQLINQIKRLAALSYSLQTWATLPMVPLLYTLRPRPKMMLMLERSEREVNFHFFCFTQMRVWLAPHCNTRTMLFVYWVLHVFYIFYIRLTTYWQRLAALTSVFCPSVSKFAIILLKIHDCLRTESLAGVIARRLFVFFLSFPFSASCYLL